MPHSTPTAEHFLTATLRQHPRGAAIARVLAAAIHAADPAAAIARHMQRRSEHLTIAGREDDLTRLKRILLIAFGKASLPMAQAAAGILADRLTAGLVIPKSEKPQSKINIPKSTIFPASHPVPDERNLQAAQAAIDLLRETRPDDLVLCLISGGGSALLTAPAEGIALADLQKLTRLLLGCGAEISEINTLRKHLSRLKGGQLARLAQPAALEALILSDVIGSPLEAIASGPTAPDPTTFTDTLRILEHYDLIAQTPGAVLERLWAGAAGDLPETPKPGDPLFARVHNTVIADNLTAAQAATAQARAEGFNAMLLTTGLKGEARQIGPVLAAIARQAHITGDPLPRPACVIAGGETTVTLRGGGLGGRNQEVALSAVCDLSGLPDALLITLATDGDDGPTDAAGAVVSGETLARARSLNLDPDDFLRRNDAYHFFEPLGDLLRPGPTHTNVNDLNFIFVLP